MGDRLSMAVARWSPSWRDPRVDRFLNRPTFDARAEAVARRVLADVRARGDRAISEYARRFDGVALKPTEFRVGEEERRRARAAASPGERAAIRGARRRIERFARAGLKRDWSMPTPSGGRVGERFVPLERVGVYVPGGKAPLVSTALMTATLARVAGVGEIVACTPCGPDGHVHPVLLYALEEAGATEIYRVGGIQAVAMMAYGTGTARKVQKIVGPGGTYVTAAKRLVYGDVALDLVAGPSEIAILADATADPRCVAADLLSQAEHGTGWEKALLVTPSRRLALDVGREVLRQAATLSRRAAVDRVIRRGMLLVVTPSMEDGVTLCNRFAPEHLEIMARGARRWLSGVRRAGAVFVGKWTPESAGDFVAGPSHVLPTGGAAAMFSGLTADDFRRRSSVIEFSRQDLRQTLRVISAFGRMEGLDGHSRSAEIRFEGAGARERDRRG